MDLMALFTALLPMAKTIDTGSASDVTAVVITGLSVVFLGLIILIIFVWALGKVFTRKKKPAETVKETPKAEIKNSEAVNVSSFAQDSSDDDEIIAVIAAAVAAMGRADGKTYKLKSVRAANTRSSRSAWSLAGLQNNTNPF
jgi:sodium pump decarboxylase gamma subunit